MEIMDGNTPCKEPLISDLAGDSYGEFINKDYKAILNDLREGKATFSEKYLERIKALPARTDQEIYCKIVACLLWFDMPARIIMRGVRIGKTWFYERLK
jgi:hypothetical protein